MTRHRILVTGAAGFIGSHLVEHLLARGDSVIGVDNFDPFYSPAEKRGNLKGPLAHPAFRLFEVDCADLDLLRQALANEPFDAVVHLAAKAGVRPSLEDPVGYARANVIGTQAMLKLCRERGVTRFVLGSSSSVYGNSPAARFRETDPADAPISPYAATKRAAELLAYTYHDVHGTSVVALRYFTVYGPRQRPDLAIRKFATLMMRGEPVPVFGDGTTERDYTWIEDIVRGTVAALDRSLQVRSEFEVINLGGSQPVPLSRLIDLLGRALGLEPRIARLPAQPGDVSRTSADVSKAASLLGYRPLVSLEHGIPSFVAWLRERGTTPGSRR